MSEARSPESLFGNITSSLDELVRGLPPDDTVRRCRVVVEAIVQDVCGRPITDRGDPVKFDSLIQRCSKESLIPRNALLQVRVVQTVGNELSHPQVYVFTTFEAETVVSATRVVAHWYLSIHKKWSTRHPFVTTEAALLHEVHNLVHSLIGLFHESSMSEPADLRVLRNSLMLKDTRAAAGAVAAATRKIDEARTPGATATLNKIAQVLFELTYHQPGLG